MSDVSTLSALELSRLYQSKTLSPVEVVDTQLSRLESLNPIYNAFYCIDHEGAREEAKKSEQRWLNGEPSSLFDGIPTSVKDALLSRGQKSYRGSAANNSDEHEWNEDCPLVARQKEAGMISLGKTTMPDFGILASGYSSQHGITRNPWNSNVTTGGSSSGTAAAICAGLNPVAAGTDIVGSIRLPASYTGLFGLKPSQGRVPYYPSNADTLVAGPMSRSVSDSAAYLNILSRPDYRDARALNWQDTDYSEHLNKARPSLRLGLLLNIGFGTSPDPETLAAITCAAQQLEDLGHRIIPIESPFSSGDEDCAELYYQQRCHHEFKQYPKHLRKQSPYIDEFTRRCEEVSAVDLFDATMAMRQLGVKTLEMCSAVDYLLLPSTPRPAFAAELPADAPNKLFDPWCNNFLFNISEQPAASINCGYTEGGLPIGLQIVGPRFDDAGVLQLARQYENIRPAQRAFPI
ncbi:amidase [Pseudoteredinibacter isoporae]|uniref:Asp-tRNA(Asn)/Glu-tRNA(Gln) amidotransferase A subunit family amidase n=1 Tax=Pseudoteredinibacter isoporae TaxID=570281 RepID=A0A7X0JR25_9GAMM|nr:amidase [Pseudoteredinibacter isoporae]MBB6520738.1 Asp-tRNA(Asn)/Glu-tRNA(Gln) amidotransferase A subunit family amidase [Pseudoteredinibacter isoporae]NHO86305.1 amidase [Pseudoteredinibacter isoporae]NIB25244.1 amidase [Pseudoteredinibacter isoporae]